MDKVCDINKIFTDMCNYTSINNLNETQLRNKKNGIHLSDAIYYKFLYAKLNTTKLSIVSQINNINNTSFTKQSFESKENNIPTTLYENIFCKIVAFYNTNCNSENKNETVVAVDGTCSNDIKYNVGLNMGYYNVTNEIPIDIVLEGSENRNKEVNSFIKYIKEHINKFKNVIFVCDRFYYTYELLKFLNDNNLKYVIRVKGSGNNLSDVNIQTKNVKHKDIINVLHTKTRIIKCTNEYDKIVYNIKSKKEKQQKHYLKVKNDCILVTNLMDLDKYSDNKVLDLYRSRWSIEVFYKYLKFNFKFQHTNEKDKEKCERLNICELILIYIAKILEHFYLKTITISSDTITKKNKEVKKCSVKINKTNFTTGIFDVLLYDIIRGKLTKEVIVRFCKSYVHVTKNETGRSYPRTSKKPFSKWYVKGYSIQSKLITIIDAIVNGKLNDLDKNAKLIAKNIKIVKTESY